MEGKVIVPSRNKLAKEAANRLSFYSKKDPLCFKLIDKESGLTSLQMVLLQMLLS